MSDATTTLQPPAANTGDSAQQSLAGKIGIYILVFYFTGCSLAYPYFTWRYIKDHSFLECVFLVWFVPPAKSLIWPYFAVSPLLEKGWTPEEKENLAHAKRSVEATQRALILAEGAGKSGQWSSPEIARVYELVKEASQEGRLVRDEVLAKIHTDYPRMYREKYLHGVTLMQQFIERGGRADDLNNLASAEKLLTEWNDWLYKNRNELRTPKDVPE